MLTLCCIFMFIPGIDDGHDIDKEMLAGIYDRVKKTPFLPGEDHTTTVQKVEQSIVGNRPVSPNISSMQEFIAQFQ